MSFALTFLNFKKYHKTTCVYKLLCNIKYKFKFKSIKFIMIIDIQLSRNVSKC